MTETLRQKLGADFRNYRIPGACNPALAYEALKAGDKVGMMLPCNVIVQEAEAEGGSEVAAIDPLASMQAIDNQALGRIAARVRDLLKALLTGFDQRLRPRRSVADGADATAELRGHGRGGRRKSARASLRSL